MMLHIPALLGTAQLAEVRRHLTSADWIDGVATAGHASRRVKRNRQLAEGDPRGAAAGAVILDALDRSAAFISAALPAGIVPPLFNRYADGEHYGPHIDGSIRPLASGRRLRTDLSATVFLSDPDTYDGGALCIGRGADEHRLKLPAGDMILYSAGTVHHVEPVRRGARIASFFWVQSIVRDEIRRGMLHDLDLAIQELAASDADHPALVAFHSHYHNLIRQWADV